ncbi:MAG TPA: alpha-L-rhamnosidase N-terminal domain-containing protein [Blastocatellia bacterium]|nr:alpha-L-rhamnosidase N-terminal domain-containing protein [Blastocatellia bacterium]
MSDKPSSARVYLSILLLLSTLPRLAAGQAINPDLLTKRWQAKWIAAPEGSRREMGVFHFRKSFTLAAAVSRFVIHASADQRYQLYVNGQRVMEGPARGDLNHWRFDSIDIAAHLRAGRNLIAAVVWNFAALAPMAQMGNETAFVVQGDTAAEAAVNTDASWKAYRSSAIELTRIDFNTAGGYYVAGPGETHNAARHPWAWETLDYDDADWKPAVVVSDAAPRGLRDSPSRWFLVPRTIPLMAEKSERLAHVRRTSGVEASDDFLQGRKPLTVPANTRATLLLDQSYLTTAYPEMVTSGGRDSVIAITYAEALWMGREKGNRNEVEGKNVRGITDRFISDGGAHRRFRPLWWRTFRYIQLNVETRAEPLTIEDLRATFTAYPFTVRAGFESDDPTLKAIWDVGWRTAQLCAHETYMDCPYYEQLQYVGDTRIQALLSLYVTGDARMVKNAIELIDESRTPEGLTQSRYPSELPQYIPTFSLLWIGMMHDLWMHRGEEQFLKPMLTGARGVLDWFEARLAPTGLLAKPEFWNFVDWTNGFKDGVPPEQGDGQSAILSLQFVAALRDAADLERAFGIGERATHDHELADRIADAVRTRCLDATRRLVSDTPAKQTFSQHANILAVLLNVIPVTEQPAVMRAVLNDATLTQCSYYFRYYLFRAMTKAGLGDEYLNQLGPWREMLKLGLTTWAETPEPSRSDCHAWSAHPNIDLLATVAGIEPAAPGFSEVVIRPHLGALKRVSAKMPHPQGDIILNLNRTGERLIVAVTLPRGLKGRIEWRGKQIALRGGAQRIAL